ncbi:hypothetical protein BSYN_25090 [Bacteroides sedimenti]|uniref:Uncharacterized protein n=1 Tax=Bacteroides sedimenti TaxID=2136147 RepID=A0ABM8IKR9_9BACE
MIDSTLVYPYCSVTQEDLDNGPLFFTVKLVYHPVTIKNNFSVVETSIISLNDGSQLNKVVVSFCKLKESLPIATGIVIHKGSNYYAMFSKKGYITYTDPKDPDNGQI